MEKRRGKIREAGEEERKEVRASGDEEKEADWGGNRPGVSFGLVIAGVLQGGLASRVDAHYVCLRAHEPK